MYDKKMYEETFSTLRASENTLAEVLRMKKDGKRQYRVTRAAFVAAIIILMLSMATVAMAYSGIGSWFLGFFSERSERTGKELTSGQQQLIEDETVEIRSSVTSGDIAITVESALSDDYNAYILLNIVAPDGIDLGGEDFRFRDESINIEHMGMGLGYRIFEDDAGKANILKMLMEISVDPRPGSTFSFKDGIAKTLTLTDICRWTMGEGLSDVLIEGTWVFDIVFSDNGNKDSRSSIELITEAVYCSAKGLMGDSQELLITSFQLSTLGAVVTYTQSQDALPEALDIFGIQIIMKDGSTVDLSPNSAIVGVFTLKLDAPIVLDEVDYVLFPDGVILTMKPVK